MKKFSVLCCFCLALLQTANTQKLKDSTETLKMQSPAVFKALFKTTQGNFIIEVYRSWSPKAADRLYQLINTGNFDNDIIFRATAKYVQFGINDDSAMNSFWDAHNILDEPVIGSNADSIVSFASGGANTRSSQIFINMQNNLKLDTAYGFGFPPVGKVVEGMNAARKFNTQYGDDIVYNHQDSIYSRGNKYLEENFPGLDRIISATILKE